MRRGNGRVCGSQATGWRSSTTGGCRRGVNIRGWSGRRRGWCRWPCWKRRVEIGNCPAGGPSATYLPGRSRGLARRSPERLQTAHRLATGRDFFGRRPVLMVVEPESLCWMAGRMVQARDGVTWAEGFARLPALKAVVRDDGTGLGKGVKLGRARRRAAGLPDLDDTLDVFHTLREGGRALRKTWGAAARALDRAGAAQKGFDRRARQGQSRQGHGAPMN